MNKCGECKQKGHNRRTRLHPKRRLGKKTMSPASGKRNTKTPALLETVTKNSALTKSRTRSVSKKTTVRRRRNIVVLSILVKDSIHDRVWGSSTLVKYVPDKGPTTPVELTEDFAKSYQKLVTSTRRAELYINEKCLPHYPTKPAYIDKDKGLQEWYHNGKYHRLDGPASLKPKKWCGFTHTDDRYMVEGQKSNHKKLCEAIVEHKIPVPRLIKFVGHEDSVVANLAAHQLLEERGTELHRTLLYEILINNKTCEQVRQQVLAHPLSDPAWDIAYRIANIKS